MIFFIAFVGHQAEVQIGAEGSTLLGATVGAQDHQFASRRVYEQQFASAKGGEHRFASGGVQPQHLATGKGQEQPIASTELQLETWMFAQFFPDLEPFITHSSVNMPSSIFRGRASKSPYEG